MGVFKDLRHRLEYQLALFGAKRLQKGSQERAQAVGRALGRMAYALGVARGTAERNLERYLGVTDRRERARIAKAAYENFGQTMTELAYLPALDPASLDLQYTFEGLEPLHAAQAAGQGIVCMSGHFGNWEWMGGAILRHGFKVTFLIGTQSNPYIDRLFNQYRAHIGLEFVRIHSIRDGLRVLKHKGMVALVGDQDGDKFGTFAPFFGVPASTHSIGELLARRSGSAMAFGVPVRLGPLRNHVKVHLIAPPPPELSEVQGTAHVLAEYNRLLEAEIRQHPEQWLWMHERFRSLPYQRLSGEPRRRAEAGEIAFDMQAQTWRECVGGEAIQIPGWK